MSKLPGSTGSEVISALSRGGFEVIRVRGSHHFLLHSDGRRTVVPVHSGETIGPGLLAQINLERLSTNKRRVSGVAVKGKKIST